MASRNGKGKKPAATLMAERAEEEAKKAKAAEVLGPQQELPGPPEAPTGEQVAAAIQDKLAEGPLAFDDLVLWTRQKFGTSMEVAEGLVNGEIETRTIYLGRAKCYTIAALERAALDQLQRCGELPLTEITGAIDAVIGAELEDEACAHVDQAIQGLRDRKVLQSRDDGEPILSLAPEAVPVAEAIASVAASRPDLVENAGTPESDAKEAHDDARDLRQDSKRLVSVMDKLRRRKSLKDQIAGLKEDLKELTDEMKGIDAELDGIGRDGEKAVDPAPKADPKPASGEPADVALPFGDCEITEDDTDATEAAQMLESVAGPVD